VSVAAPDDMLLVRPSWTRLKYCERRNAWLFLVPERVLFPCPITVEILQRIEKPQRLSVIARDLSSEYDAPEAMIKADIADLIGGFVEKGYVRRVDE
jgi:hypothetical protein